jgi:pimeloyl-ACP methyl ester carboxylesterase
MAPKLLCLLCMFACALPGCRAPRADRGGVVLFVPGALGDGPWYDGVRYGVRDVDPTMTAATFRWGAPLPFALLNLNAKWVHERAERRLAQRISVLAQNRPVSLIAHSAGCGVALGALRRLPQDAVRDVVLLHPSVSPHYELDAAVRRTRGRLIVVYSDRDTLFLKWRTRHFGTYDGVKAAAAGNRGFDLRTLRPDVQERVEQLQSEPIRGRHEGHFTATSRESVRNILRRLWRSDEQAVVGEPGVAR